MTKLEQRTGFQPVRCSSAARGTSRNGARLLPGGTSFISWACAPDPRCEHGALALAHGACLRAVPVRPLHPHLRHHLACLKAHRTTQRRRPRDKSSDVSGPSNSTITLRRVAGSPGHAPKSAPSGYPLSRTRSQVRAIGVPVSRTRSQVRAIGVPVSRTRSQVRAIGVPVSRTRSQVRSVGVPVSRTRSQVRAIGVPVSRTRSQVRAIGVPALPDTLPSPLRRGTRSPGHAPKSAPSGYPFSRTRSQVRAIGVPVPRARSPVCSVGLPASWTCPQVRSIGQPVSRTHSSVRSVGLPRSSELLKTQVGASPVTRSGPVAEAEAEAVAEAVAADENCCDDDVRQQQRFTAAARATPNDPPLERLPRMSRSCFT